LAGVVHTAQVFWQSRDPELQVSPQLVPSHVAAPFGDVGHAEQLEPHVATSVFETHELPQR